MSHSSPAVGIWRPCRAKGCESRVSLGDLRVDEPDRYRRSGGAGLHRPRHHRSEAVGHEGSGACDRAHRRARSGCGYSFQNGVEKDDVLRSEFGGAPVMGGVGYISAILAEPELSRTRQDATSRLRRVRREHAPRAPSCSRACRLAEIDAELSDDIRRAIWEKFVFLVGLSGATATMRAPIGSIRSNPRSRAFLLDAMREVVAVGRTQGVTLAEDYAEHRLAFCDGLPEEMVSRRTATSCAGFGWNCPG